MSNSGIVRLFVQFLVAVAVLWFAFYAGILSGTLEPLLHPDGWGAPAVVLITILGYLVVLGPLALLVVITNAPSGESEPSSWDQGTGRSLVWSVPGVIVGTALVFGVPDWLSTTLPLVALSAAAVAFVFAGDAIGVRGLDTALWSASGTIFLILLPAVLYPVLKLGGILVAVVIGPVCSLAVRGWLGDGSTIDRRISVSLALVFALVASGAMAYDLSGPRPATELDTDATVNLSAAENRSYARLDTVRERPMVRVGTLTVRNGFDFERTALLPPYSVCLYGENGTRTVDSRVSAPVVEIDDFVEPVDDVRLPSGIQRRYGVVVLLDSVDGRPPSEIRELGTVPVRRANSCPETTDGPALVLVPADEN